MTHVTYAFLYALSVVAINPWGDFVGAIWTAPKVYVLCALLVLNVAFLLRDRQWWEPTLWWRRAAWLWAALLVVGLVTSLLSPAPRRALLGQSALGDGWVYWSLLAGLLLSNALVLRARPAFLKAQLLGLLVGGGLFALSIFPQVLDNTLDYTATSGQKVRSRLLISGVHLEHQPVGFTSNRGHASVVVALTLTLALVSLMRRWLSLWFLWPLIGVSGLALWFTDSRGGVVAALLGLLYLGLMFKRGRKSLIAALLLLALGWGAYMGIERFTGMKTRPMPELTEGVRELTSGRLGMWRQALWAIGQRPLRGYGFDGFGTAWPSIAARRAEEPREILSIGDRTYRYRSGGQVYTEAIPNFHDKAHNFILDWLLAVGVPGFALYAALLGVLTLATVRSSVAPLAALLVVYVGFTLTWYDAAQFTHLGFWGVSAGLGFADKPDAPAQPTSGHTSKAANRPRSL